MVRDSDVLVSLYTDNVLVRHCFVCNCSLPVVV